jgi:dienelactone hydrolase
MNNVHIAVLAAALVSALPAATAEHPRPGRNDLSIRGKGQEMYYVAGRAAGESPGCVLFVPGDGGWRGTAVEMADTIASWGYSVFGLDTKHYLESFTDSGSRLKPREMASDMETAGRWASAENGSSCTFVGWSQGAAMGVLALSTDRGKDAFSGLVAVGLPESAVLGWTWKDTLASAAKREPDEPHFAVEPLLRGVAPEPFWMIQASGDEYTTPAAARKLFAAAAPPSRFVEIEGSNHRFDGKREQFYSRLREGLDWVAHPPRRNP